MDREPMTADNLDEVALEAARTRAISEWRVEDYEEIWCPFEELPRFLGAVITAYLSEAPTHKLYRSARTKLATSEQEVERLRLALVDLYEACPKSATISADGYRELHPDTWERYGSAVQRAGAALTPSVEGGERG